MWQLWLSSVTCCSANLTHFRATPTPPPPPWPPPKMRGGGRGGCCVHKGLLLMAAATWLRKFIEALSCCLQRRGFSFIFYCFFFFTIFCYFNYPCVSPYFLDFSQTTPRHPPYPSGMLFCMTPWHPWHPPRVVFSVRAPTVQLFGQNTRKMHYDSVIPFN